MISIEFKAEFRRGSRELVENAVARRISIVFEDSLPGIVIFDTKDVNFNKKYVNFDKKHVNFDTKCVNFDKKYVNLDTNT